jgi:RNA polymerase sigma-70 factor (ECF subfamily)
MWKRMAKTEDPIETELVKRSKNGDPAAFEELTKRARPLCQTVARSILGDEAEAEDQVQNALLKAWRGIQLFRHDASFGSWVCRIVTNECLMLVRRRNRFPHMSIDESSGREEWTPSTFRDKTSDPEELAASDEVREMLSRELRCVPKIFQTVLVMFEVRNMPIDEIAAQLGISTSAAKSRLVRARRALRDRVQVHTGRIGLVSLLPQR